MKKSVIVLCLLLLFSVAVVGAEKPLGVEEYGSVNELALALSSYFPKVQGEVKSVQGDRLTVLLGSKDGLKSGVTLTLWRAGKEILHPVTGAVLGRTEEEIGEAEVTEVGETSSTMRVLKKLKEPQPGDIARISPKKIHLALVPLRPDRMDIVYELAVRLGEAGRFSVLETSKTAAFLKDKKQRDASLVKEMGKTFGVEVVASVEIYPSEGGKLLVTVGMFYAEDARPIRTTMAMLNLQSKKEGLAEVKPFFAPDKEEAGFFLEGKSFTAGGKVTPGLPIKAQLFVAADLEGNGKLHYIFTDGERLHVYQQEEKGWREEWSETGSFAAGEMQHINIDVADINANGRPELFVTAMQNDRVFSYVMEFQGGSFQRIAAMPGFLRVVTYPGKGTILIGQSYNEVSFYLGKPRQYVWSQGTYVAGPEFPLPKGVDLYGFAVAGMGEPQPFLVALNKRDQLVVYSKNNAIWKSEEQYPAIGIEVIKPLTGLDAYKKEAAVEAERMGNPPLLLHQEKVKISGRVLALDMIGDGKEVIVVPRNGVLPYLGSVGINYVTGYYDADCVGLGWNGTRLDQQFSIKRVPGIVLDVQIVRQQDTAKLLVLTKIPGWWIKKDTFQVTAYTLKEK